MNKYYKILCLLLIIKNIFLCDNFFTICENNNICIDYITKINIKIFLKKNITIPSELKFILFSNINVCINHNNQFIKKYNKYDNDNFNLSLIYPEDIIKNKTIRIVHKGNENIENKILCIFGILENKNGYKIEKEMLEWLLPEYDVYCVYQKYPGILYEYPAIRFAQYIINNKKNDYALYIHSKGAFYPSQLQNDIRDVWKIEYTKSNKINYVRPLKKNIADVTCIITNQGKITWFNSFFATKKGFNFLGKIKPSKCRYDFESQFSKTNAKVLGILSNNSHHPLEIINKYIYNKKLKYKIFSYEYFFKNIFY